MLSRLLLPVAFVHFQSNFLFYAGSRERCFKYLKLQYILFRQNLILNIKLYEYSNTIMVGFIREFEFSFVTVHEIHL